MNSVLLLHILKTETHHSAEEDPEFFYGRVFTRDGKVKITRVQEHNWGDGGVAVSAEGGVEYALSDLVENDKPKIFYIWAEDAQSYGALKRFRNEAEALVKEKFNNHSTKQASKFKGRDILRFWVGRELQDTCEEKNIVMRYSPDHGLVLPNSALVEGFEVLKPRELLILANYRPLVDTGRMLHGYWKRIPEE